MTLVSFPLRSKVTPDKMPVSDGLTEARMRASPRLSPRRVPWISRLVIGAILMAFVLLVAQAFVQDSLAAWSVGIAYVAYDTALLLFTGLKTLDILRRREDGGTEDPPADLPRITVIIAAHDEERALVPTINALLAQTLPPAQILIADDGSTDGTKAVLRKTYGLDPPPVGELSAPAAEVPALCWLRLAHAGKAAALNAALSHAEHPVVLTVDADTILDPGALAAVAQDFAADLRLVAATGVLAPACGPGLSERVLQGFQTYEYLRNFISRHAWMRLDCLLLVSGAFAAFRRDAVMRVGGFDPGCLVEDYELIHRLRRHSAENGLDWSVRVIGRARGRTDAPGSLRAFLAQRRRWFGGFLQTHYWNRDMIGNPRFGRLGTVMMPVKTLDTLQPVFGIIAFALLVCFLVTSRAALAVSILSVMGAKIAVDLCFHLWSIHLYRRWTGAALVPGMAPVFPVALAEPFSFQLLRHLAAVLGWWTFVTGRQRWARHSRAGVGQRPVG
ncbi:Glycosyltransferase, catalytic subunit of cellulose synthase and poly-beta-1,6-N-acetylglucosamine synthase [Roseovarius azorensis]|uniref:Glycosyltransferase, catalytic subunit of cellulose synthase and poly-beta-1,6-N-acetylglucosamine synthase n=2 Tax=Roseovarius azorensis TaxID=1287727 RepID=A0A1H7NL31_9RHOB|nr:Glycosyltransferase, catalytic subunit of cellulose synthase and poly-beta-1,6-N-acetylglucosamine synthase [Roseovarius azorensis]